MKISSMLSKPEFTSLFFYKGIPLSLKRSRWKYLEKFVITNVTVKNFGAIPTEEIAVFMAKMSPSVEIALIKEKMDFLYSRWLQSQMIAKRHNDTLKNQFWSMIYEQSEERAGVLKDFLLKEQEFVQNKSECFLLQVARELDSIDDQEGLLRYRKYISETYIIGGLNNFLIGADSDI